MTRLSLAPTLHTAPRQDNIPSMRRLSSSLGMRPSAKLVAKVEKQRKEVLHRYQQYAVAVSTARDFALAPCRPPSPSNPTHSDRKLTRAPLPSLPHIPMHDLRSLPSLALKSLSRHLSALDEFVDMETANVVDLVKQLKEGIDPEIRRRVMDLFREPSHGKASEQMTMLADQFHQQSNDQGQTVKPADRVDMAVTMAKDDAKAGSSGMTVTEKEELAQQFKYELKSIK